MITWPEIAKSGANCRKYAYLSNAIYYHSVLNAQFLMGAVVFNPPKSTCFYWWHHEGTMKFKFFGKIAINYIDGNLHCLKRWPLKCLKGVSWNIGCKYQLFWDLNLPHAAILVNRMTSHACHYYQNTTSFFVLQYRRAAMPSTSSKTKWRHAGNSKAKLADI